MLTNRLENDNAFGPPSHGVGPCSEGWLKSWLKSALQSTRSTADCPALRRYPREIYISVSDHRGTKGVQTLLQWGGKPTVPASRWRTSVVAAQRITSSAWKRSVGGMMRPSTWAVLRLMTSSNF